jgi:ATP-dependent DNA ligase
MTSDGLKVLKLLYSPANLFVDGELYLHGKSLNWISGQVRKEGDEGTLEYWIYDCFFPAAIASGYQMTSKHRQEYLDMLFKSVNLKYVKRVINYKVKKLSDIHKYRDEFLAEGYEGAIVRKDWTGYTYGNNNYHSSNLVKVKPIYDAEFKVVGFTQGTKGKDVGALIWICEVDPEHVIDPADKTFNVVPKDMTYEERYKIFELLNLKSGPENNFNKYVNGKYLTVEFPERSKKTGKPSQAKALNFRNLDTDSNEDPIKLMKNS